MLAIALAGLAGLIAYDRLGAPGYGDLPLSARLAMSEQTYKTRPSQTEAEAAAPAARKDRGRCPVHRSDDPTARRRAKAPR